MKNHVLGTKKSIFRIFRNFSKIPKILENSNFWVVFLRFLLLSGARAALPWEGVSPWRGAAATAVMDHEPQPPARHLIESVHFWTGIGASETPFGPRRTP